MPRTIPLKGIFRGIFLPKPYFLTRPSGLYVRYQIPKPIRLMLGCRFIVRSLGRLRGDPARLAAAVGAMALSEVFTGFTGGSMSADEFKKKIDQFKVGKISVGPDGMTLEGIEVEDDADAERLQKFVSAIPKQVRGYGGFDDSYYKKEDLENYDGHILSKCIEDHITDMRLVDLNGKNILDTIYTLKLFLELTGDRPLNSVKTSHVRTFLETIEFLPANASKKPQLKDKPLKEIIEAGKTGEFPLIQARTKKKHKDRLKAFFNSQVRQNNIDRAPHIGIINVAKGKAEESTKPEFSKEDINIIFGSDFREWAKKYPHRFFGAMIGYATGARVNEIAQLYCDDFEQVHGVYGIHIRKKREDQKLKNRHSSRFVPLPQVLTSSFLTYMEEVKAAGFDRPFPNLTFTKAAGYGDALSDQFSKYVKSLGLEDRKTFHSFRHSIVGGLVNEIGIQINIMQEITGHDLTLPGAMKHYINPSTIEARHSAIEKYTAAMEFPAYEAGMFKAAFSLAKNKQKQHARKA